MRLLLVNPNATERITDIMAAEARRSASHTTEIVTATARFGTPYIENRAEAAIAAHATLDTLADRAEGCDAAIVSAFGDPGLAGARELFDFPVVGISDAALLMAWTLGRRHAIVCLTPRLRTWYMECAAEHGLAGRLASVRALDGPIADITRVREDLGGRVLELCLRAVDEDGAEVLIIGGGPLAWLAREIGPRLPVPALDGVSCGVRLAEALVALGPRPPARGSLARPRGISSTGLGPALARMLERRPPTVD